jgi:hypothetical protein
MFGRHLIQRAAVITTMAAMMLSFPMLTSAQELDPVVVVNDLQERT